MSKASPIVLILGAGSNVGQHVADAFRSKGYRIALAARSVKESDNTAEQVYLPSDFSDPNSIVNAFSKLKSSLGVPSVVVYNASAGKANPPNSPLSATLADFTQALNINTTSAFVAAQQAVLAFEQLPASAPTTFIFTGNVLNTTILAPLMLGGVGKSATAHMIQSAAAAYADKGYKFYYADERKADGQAAYSIDGAAHGEQYVALAEGKSQGPWFHTFVKGVGYKKFPAA
ncbi:uncharacterized protein DNG_09267 [Cephalotrichum gorgonifer]|uniref:Short chain type dehydrogenase n=1 Tax=Cephalotrichum gorgonifer TaxID=2041049 RepID=A0AAE8N5H6_9PEZI|nr:uncharacterized protein DNG_09267 [Cephalotrichum gorgonifer]